MALPGRREDEVRAGGDVNAILGRGAEFQGKLTFEGEVRIGGKFDGEIFSKDRLQIDEGAEVKGQIVAGTVIVHGEVTGTIKASQGIEFKSGAKVRGDIETPQLVVERGVFFDGHCKMELKAGAQTPPPTPTLINKP